MAWLLLTSPSPSGTSALHQTVLWLPASLDLAGIVQAGLAEKFCAPPFQDNNGVIGLLEPMKKSMVPVQVQLSVSVVKVASGGSGGTCSGQELENLVLGWPSFGPYRQALHPLHSSHPQEMTIW